MVFVNRINRSKRLQFPSSDHRLHGAVFTLKNQPYRFQTAPTGEAAILDAPSYNPDVILLDLGLPDIDGISVIRKIRSWSKIPIIVLSSHSEDMDKIDALGAGTDDYLT